jgi:hypothetical protein
MVSMPEKTWDALAGFRAVAPGTKSTRRTLVIVGAVTAFGAVLTAIGLFTGAGSGRTLATGATLLITGALGLIGIWLWLTNVRLLVGQGVVGYRDFFGRSRLWSRGEIDHIVSMAVSYGKSSQPMRAIYCFGPDGKRLLALNVRAWPHDDLNEFVESTGRPLDVRDDPITAKDARREFPNAFGLGSQHVMLLTILTMLGAVVLVVAGYVVMSKLLLK